MGNIPDRSILDLLKELEGGQFVDELTNILPKITQAVMETRKAGALKISLKFSPTGRGSVEVDAEFDEKIPEHDRSSTTFFVDGELNLVRNDPNQPTLPLREADVPRNTPIRAV